MTIVRAKIAAILDDTSCALALFDEAISGKQKLFNLFFWEKICRKYARYNCGLLLFVGARWWPYIGRLSRAEWEIFHLWKHMYSFLIISWHFDSWNMITRVQSNCWQPVIMKLIVGTMNVLLVFDRHSKPWELRNSKVNHFQFIQNSELLEQIFSSNGNRCKVQVQHKRPAAEFSACFFPSSIFFFNMRDYQSPTLTSTQIKSSTEIRLYKEKNIRLPNHWIILFIVHVLSRVY